MGEPTLRKLILVLGVAGASLSAIFVRLSTALTKLVKSGTKCEDSVLMLC
jgi:hypothetical protein